ncbi:MAG: mediator complex subunit [Heterodermia speciosa]|uniref:Mediator of RNA polymerase II transcription subunit 5 n=1 Tax=Heterodermia speciosa TaxID=116794 RepID=A0A8H3IVA6_9LECA|nr:MAG: mediator complex subunit [Heterodermia speciosa]
MESPKEIHTFFEACLRKRLSREKFRLMFITFHAKHTSTRGRKLVDALLHEISKPAINDPRLPLYIRELLALEIVSVADVLWSMLPPPLDLSLGEQPNFYDQSMLEVHNVRKPTIAAIMVQMLTSEIAEGSLKTAQEVLATLKGVVAWINLFPGSSALGYLVTAFLSVEIVQRVLGQRIAKGPKKIFGRSLATLINQTMQSNIQIATALDFWRKQYEFIDDEGIDIPESELQGPNLGSLTFQQSVIDTPPVNTRAGAYIYLNALIHDRPLFEDQREMNYFGARYKGDVTTLVIELILASFDVLANAMYRSEPSETLTMLRSFLVNKLPSFLLSYSPMLFEPMTVEYCISQAFLRIDPAAFPSFSQMFDSVGRNGMLSEARVEFLLACALHRLIPEQSIETLLGEDPMQNLPTGGRYIKDQLMEQCRSNPARIEELARELENMEGNAGEIASALVEIMHSLCVSKDTMALKIVCDGLSRRPPTLDVLLLFTSIHELLNPLCETLDSWQMHEDQGEHQPVYDEFGSVLLFVSLVQYRFDLRRYELSASPSESFMVQYTAEAATAKALEDISEKESKLLGAWIRGLFNENEGINDELMATSSPSDFHMIVATLLDQSLKACQAGFLAMSTLKDGLEYLLEPFLLPSLVAGLKWFGQKLWETTEQSLSLDFIMPALTTLLKPRSISADSSALHSALLTIVAKPLEDSLIYAQRRHPQRSDIKPLLEVLSRHGQKQRHKAAAFSELESWSNSPGGGLQAALKSTIQSLIFWDGVASAHMSPPRYTHRQLTLTIQTLGAKAVLDTLIEELMTHVTPDGALTNEAALEVVAVMILAPQAHFLDYAGNTSAQKSQLSLGDALHAEIDSVFELSKKDHSRATMIVRLYRRIGALVGPQMREADNAAVMDDSMAGVVTHRAEDLPTEDIDEVLGQVNEQAAVMDFMAGGTGDFMNLT